MLKVNNVFISNSPATTKEIAADLAGTLQGGEVIAFYGDLGQGKTCFVTGLAEGLGFSGEVSSPTFAIINEYIGGRLNLYHFDMYRVSGWDDLYSTGYFEYMESGGVLAVEWSENIEAALPDDTIRITIKRIDETTREITIDRGNDV
ncbi:MAG: tRNA (adenosine(37)-N6)-threonylcarbamoyltransferase complex ATPase subunit type 1 TsaE [Clostridia bacterium]|nr:tRNA (adenosine(37)-N6)-threonylcarbamoyltransferase complex ATPase subunit type 1 TsaE [Clostridia bacterium]